MPFVPPIIMRAIVSFFRSLTSKPAVYVYNARVNTGGASYFLFTSPLSDSIRVRILTELIDMPDIVSGSLAVGRHSVSLEWSRSYSGMPLDMTVRNIELTVFLAALDTYEPNFERWSMPMTEAFRHISKVGQQQGINWAGELGIRIP